MTIPFKTVLKEEDRLYLRDGVVYDITLDEMSSLSYILRSLKETVLKYGTVVIKPTTNWLVYFDKSTTATFGSVQKNKIGIHLTRSRSEIKRLQLNHSTVASCCSVFWNPLSTTR